MPDAYLAGGRGGGGGGGALKGLGQYLHQNLLLPGLLQPVSRSKGPKCARLSAPCHRHNKHKLGSSWYHSWQFMVVLKNTVGPVEWWGHTTTQAEGVEGVTGPGDIAPTAVGGWPGPHGKRP